MNTTSYTETIGGITFTVDSNNATLTYTGSGKLTEDHAGFGAEYLIKVMMDEPGGVADTVSVNIGSGITADTQSLELIKEIFFDYGVKYVNINNGNSSTAAEQPVGGFTDVKPSDYFADPVVWAVDKKITAGTSAMTFSPNENCTVAQILSFLWRANGSPRSSVNNPFSDVKSSDYYYGAALWAYEKGMVTGSTFDGSRPCTRSMAVNYMWQAAGVAYADFEFGDGYLAKYTGSSSSDVVIPDIITFIGMDWYPEPERLTSVTIPSSVTSIEMMAFSGCDNLTDIYYEGSEAQWKAIRVEAADEALTKATIHYNSKMPQPSVNTGFTDVPATADYAQAVAWAVEQGVTAGTSATTFSPDQTCTRGQIVTFLHRALAK